MITWEAVVNDAIGEDAAREIIRETCYYAGVPFVKVMGKTRAQPIAWIRQVCMWRMRRELGMSYPAIGDVLGRDHTTVMHGVEKVGEKYATIAENSRSS